MPLSWNEIKTKAASFVLEWKDSQTVREKAEAQTFETEFLKIFGIVRKKVALFEHEVHFEDSNERGYIDLFWKGHIIIETKTPGKDLDKAYEQANAYALSLPQKEIPRGILTCDFLNFQYYDPENDAIKYNHSKEIMSRARIKKAERVLEARKKFSELSLAELYDTTSMLPDLVKAHQKLDKAVEAAYGRSFDDDSQRVAYLFELYQKLSGELFVEEKKKSKGRKG
jgi:hypothetical protein